MSIRVREADGVALFMMLNNLFHDFAVALLLAALFAVWLAGRSDSGIPKAALRKLYARMARITYVCWAVILVGGVVRTIGYRQYEWAEAAGRGQVAALAVKHVLLIALVALGVWGQLRLRKRLTR
jgi:fatty-acid desaturase